MVHVDPSLAATVVAMLNNTLTSVKTARELAKSSSDTQLKEQLNDIYDAFLSLKEKMLELKDENGELQRRLTEQESIKRDPKTGFYFREGEHDPLCPTCYQKHRLTFYLEKELTNPVDGSVYRSCRSCSHIFTGIPR